MLFQVLVFDFQPKDPEDIYVALATLSGRAVLGQISILVLNEIIKSSSFYDKLGLYLQLLNFLIGVSLHKCLHYLHLNHYLQIIFSGAVLVRKLRRLPQSKCWLVGYAKTDAVETATEFNRKWETNLKIGLNDCRDYTNGNIYN